MAKAPTPAAPKSEPTRAQMLQMGQGEPPKAAPQPETEEKTDGEAAEAHEAE